MPDAHTVLFRVDPRLVHATLTNAWVPAQRAQRLIVADSAVAADDRRRTIVEIAAVDVGRVEFVNEEDAAAAVEASTVNTIVLFSGLAAVEAAIDHGLPVATLNVGHIPDGPEREQYLPAVFLGPDELAAIRRLQSKGVKVSLQSLPDDKPVFIDPPAPDPGPDEGGHHAEAEFEVVNERGLHLRAAHVLAARCNQFPNHIEVGRDGFMVNAKSLLGLTALGAAAGTRLKIAVTGPGAADVLEALRELFAGGFDEGVAPGMKRSE